jgi:hypothetical protein
VRLTFRFARHRLLKKNTVRVRRGLPPRRRHAGRTMLRWWGRDREGLGETNGQKRRTIMEGVGEEEGGPAESAQVRWGRALPPFLLQLQEPQQHGQRPIAIGPPPRPRLLCRCRCCCLLLLPSSHPLSLFPTQKSQSHTHAQSSN